jgi:hypothetical protein
MTADLSGFPAAGCRLHGPGCSVPWGYDPDHTDQRHPYTVEQLAVREVCPHRYAYPTPGAYIDGWRLWRAFRRDEGLSPAEADARWTVTVEHILGALPPDVAAAVKEHLSA